MSTDEISKLINELPNIIMYILPGYIGIQMYNYILNVKGKELRNSIMEYVLSSFLIITIVEWIYNYLDYNFSLVDTSTKLIICIISFVGSYILTMIFRTTLFIGIIRFLGINRNNAPNILSDIHDYAYGTWLRVYIASEKIIYDGKMCKFEHKGSYQDSFLVISDYETYRYGETTVDDSWYTKDVNELTHLIIKLSDISRIEATYDVRSEKLIKEDEITINTLPTTLINWVKSKFTRNNNGITINQ